MKEEDKDSLSAYQSDPTYLAHYTETPDAHAIVTAAIRWAQEDPRANFQYAVVLKPAGNVIGCAGLRQRGYPAGEAEVGVEINPRYWRQGFAKETLTKLLDFGVQRLGIVTFWAETTDANEPAKWLVKQLGFSPVDARDESTRLRLSIHE